MKASGKMTDMEQFKVAILTKSNKHRDDGGYGCCIAGVSETGEWIRFVADANGDSLPRNTEINTRQIILAEGWCAPLKYQTENVVLCDFHLLQGRVGDYVKNLKQTKEAGIFGNTANSLSYAEMSKITGTLRLIEVQNLEIYWNSEQKCKVRFERGNTFYEAMPMTDPIYYTKKGSPPKAIGDAFIVVSLSEYPPFNKFVAAIYPKKDK